MRVAVTGAGGAIAGHLIDRLLDDGHEVIGLDVKPRPEWWQWHYDATNVDRLDVSDPPNAEMWLAGVDEVYNLAADMGGIGFITGEAWACMNSTAINLAVLNACIAQQRPVRYFYSSSACVYPMGLQQRPQDGGLRECDAYPADPEPGYGEEKLYGERLAQVVGADPRNQVTTRIARYHNIFSAPGSWTGGREKAPAAICRKVAEAKLSGVHEIEIWGDGTATRSYLDVADCVDGTLAVMRSDHPDPLNVGSDRQVSVDELVTIVERIAGVSLSRRYDLSAPRGVAGRNSDNTLCQVATGWSPAVTLEDGLATLYEWVEARVAAR